MNTYQRDFQLFKRLVFGECLVAIILQRFSASADRSKDNENAQKKKKKPSKKQPNEPFRMGKSQKLLRAYAHIHTRSYIESKKYSKIKKKNGNKTKKACTVYLLELCIR